MAKPGLLKDTEEGMRCSSHRHVQNVIMPSSYYSCVGSSYRSRNCQSIKNNSSKFSYVRIYEVELPPIQWNLLTQATAHSLTLTTTRIRLKKEHSYNIMTTSGSDTATPTTNNIVINDKNLFTVTADKGKQFLLRRSGSDVSKWGS